MRMKQAPQESDSQRLLADHAYGTRDTLAEVAAEF
jgi:hypothetical protein